MNPWLRLDWEGVIAAMTAYTLHHKGLSIPCAKAFMMPEPPAGLALDLLHAAAKENCGWIEQHKDGVWFHTMIGEVARAD